MLSNRRSMMMPAASSDTRPTDRVSVCNPRPAWRHSTTSADITSYNNNNHNHNILHSADGADSQQPQPHCATPSVLTSTTAQLPGYAVRRAVGAIHGTTTGALPPNNNKDGSAKGQWLGKSSARGGGMGMGAEVRGLTGLLYGLREVAMERMAVDCVARGGNAVVGVSYAEGEVMGCLTVSVQGTAVYVEPVRGAPQAGGAVGQEQEMDPFRGS